MSGESNGHDEQSTTEEQPQPGQPQGRQVQGSAPVQASGESGVGDIFNREDTKSELKVNVAGFAVVGLGVGLAILLIDILDDEVFQFAGGLGSAVTIPLIAAPILATFFALRNERELADLSDNLVYATAGIASLIGTFVLSILNWLFNEITFDRVPDIGDLFLGWLGIAIGAAVTAVAFVAVLRKL